MKRRIVCLILAMLLLCGASMGTAAAEGKISVVIDNVAVKFSSEYGYPFIDENERTQVPLRAVMEAYGCDVSWNGETRCAVVSKDDTTVVVPIGEKHIFVNEERVDIDTAAVIKEERTYLPIRAVLEAFGATVEWLDGVVLVTSPADSAFRDIYVSDDGDLIFVLANGTEINAGNISGEDGYNGRDGVSVRDAEVNADGELILTLSNGKTINAGYVGGASSGDTRRFTDEDIGKIYKMTAPGENVDIPFIYAGDGKEYICHLETVYYEYLGEREPDDPDIWRVNKNGNTYYRPYIVKLHVKASVDPKFAGKRFYIGLSTPGNISSEEEPFVCTIKEDGTIDTTFLLSIVGPEEFFLNRISVSTVSA